MKLLKPWRSASGGLLHLTLLLSLAGLRLDLDLNLDLYLLLSPPTQLRDGLLGDSLTRSAYALSPFPAWTGRGRAGLLHPKGPELDPTAPLEGHLLREVRALGVPFIPRTRVDAWLVHSVATGDADGAHGLLGAAASSAVGEGSSQATPGDGRDPQSTRGSPLVAAEEEKAVAEPRAQVPDAGGQASQENEIPTEKNEAAGHSSQQEEKEEGLSAQEKPLHHSEAGNERADAPNQEAEKTSASRDESHLNWTDASFSLEDFFQLCSSQPEHSLEGISLEGVSPLSGTNSSHNINLTQAISHDVNLHEAMLLCSNTTFRRDPITRISQVQEPSLQLNFHTNPEQALSATNLTGFLPPADGQMRNLTNQDLCDLDTNIFDEINLMSLAAEEGFDPLEVSQLFEERDSDSGLSLNSSHNSTFITKSNFSHSTYGAADYSSDLQSHDLQGAVGYSPEPAKSCPTDLRNVTGFHEDFVYQHVFHNHTYHLQPGTESNSQSLTWPEKSQKGSRYHDDMDKNLSRDERRAKALHIPFSVDEIVGMPVDSFNNILSRYYLTDLQVSLIRDIRRRGKNKVAAQNCRKRKLDIILSLEGDVCNLQAKKETLEKEQVQFNKAIDIMKQKLNDLYHDVFSRLRDDQGRPVNPNQYALQCSHDGTVLIVPKELVTSGHKKETQKRKRERRN